MSSDPHKTRMGHRRESICKWHKPHNQKESLTNVVITTVCLARPVASNFQVGVHCKPPPAGSGAEPQRKSNLCILAWKSGIWWHQI